MANKYEMIIISIGMARGTNSWWRSRCSNSPVPAIPVWKADTTLYPPSLLTSSASNQAWKEVVTRFQQQKLSCALATCWAKAAVILGTLSEIPWTAWTRYSQDFQGPCSTSPVGPAHALADSGTSKVVGGIQRGQCKCYEYDGNDYTNIVF